MSNSPNVLALSGGVGGAKLALGLSLSLPVSALSIVANTADDFLHLGLPISPDLDTVMYTLAGLNNREQGWGLAGESWHCMTAVERLGGPSWFRLGDQDIATHLMRLNGLQQGHSLTQVTENLCRQLDVDHQLLPMCDEAVRTHVQCAPDNHHDTTYELPFQSYFVEQQCKPAVTGFRFEGVERAVISPAVASAIENADIMVVCPSNPFVSIAPILGVPGLKQRVLDNISTRVVVSPIVGGIAIKGPAAKMMAELDMPLTPLAVAEYYQGFASHFVLDTCDECFVDDILALDMQVLVTNTVMNSLEDRKELADSILRWIQASG
ncbi:2-phospho-L-lactate transferase [BD1-7 clade bacterium]|uniref:2-phospho-L-lactate transferase n=1 Tax=BD1-7 clade bacterium TaxID=2029982 RepID=A0A5S9QWE2_9GAMM|nr:2-phospho-L-lactate transferase [BD1-7 clade bacterium]CAA0122800.1 2-phospho-L-lactate transferase [BD1-7 clade bacterium]